VTTTPGTTLPEASVTVPVSVAKMDWAWARPALAASARASSAHAPGCRLSNEFEAIVGSLIADPPRIRRECRDAVRRAGGGRATSRGERGERMDRLAPRATVVA